MKIDREKVEELAKEYGVFSFHIPHQALLRRIKFHERNLNQEHLFPVGLKEKYHFEGADTNRRAITFILDKTREFIIVVHEKVYPLTFRRIGPPKGRVKEGEELSHARNREVAEEIGLDLEAIPLEVLAENCRVKVVSLNKSRDEVELFRGNEICKVEWVNVEWLLEDIEKNPQLYNCSLRSNCKYLKFAIN